MVIDVGSLGGVNVARYVGIGELGFYKAQCVVSR
jgi:hypothetical protein